MQYPTDLFVGPQDRGLNDVTRQVLAYRTLLRTEVHRSDQVPLWNPWAMGGAAWYGNPQSGLLYPPNWLYLCCPEVDCVNWLVFAHHWWAGFGTYLLARRFGLCWLASVASGVFYLGAPYLIAQTCEGHVSQVCLMSWAPWLWLAYERIRTRQAGGIPGAACVMSLAFFCGHVQELYYLVLMFSAFAFWDGTFQSDPLHGSRRWGVTAKWLLAGCLTAGMVALEFLPIWIYLRQAVRASGISVAQASQGTLELRSLLQLVDPLAFGGPQHSLRPESYAWGTYWESIFYFGIGPLLLAFWGACRGQGRYPAGRLVGVFLIAVLFSFGDKTPLFPLLHQYLPGAGMFRSPMRALFHASFAVALLAGLGLDVMVTAFGPQQQKLVAMAWKYWGWIFTLGCLGVVLASGELGPFQVQPGKWPQMHWLQIFGYAVGVSLPLLMALFFPDHRQLWCTLCLLVCLADLSLHARAVTHTIPMTSWRQSNPILDKIKNEVGASRFSVPQILVSDREAWQQGIRKIQAYEPVPLVLWGEFLSVLCPKIDPATTLTGFTPLPMQPYQGPLLDLLGVKYAAVTGHTEQPPPGWKLIERGQITSETTLREGRQSLIPYTLLKNERAMPRAYVVYHARRVPDHKQAKTALSNFNPRTEVVVDARVPEFPPTKPGREFTPVEITRDQPNQLVLKIPELNRDANQPAFLCLTDLHFPGWTATFNGTPLEIYPGNLSFRVIPLPVEASKANAPEASKPGAGSEVVMTFQPPGIRLGLMVSTVGWAAWLLLTIRSLIVNRRQRAGGTTA